MIPKCRIMTYTGAVNDYTIENDVVSANVKDVLNGVGTFQFSLPTVKGIASDGYLYTDIAINDKATFYFWDAETGSCPGTPDFAGKISKISAPLASTSGYYRVFEGKSEGEVLLRRINFARYWPGNDAHDIVDAICDDLLLGKGSVESDAAYNTDHHETIFCSGDTYFDLLKKASDYYVAAGNVKQDFYVDVSDNLVWHHRPIRTAGVETLTVGTNIDSYDVLRDVEPVKNYIKVYGQLGKFTPSDKDSWTENSTDGWTCDLGGTAGAVATDAAIYKIGAKSIKLTMPAAPAAGVGHLIKTFAATSILPPAGYTKLHFYMRTEDIGNNWTSVDILAPDTSNTYYVSGWTQEWATMATWSVEYIVDFATITGITGSPSLTNIQGIRITPPFADVNYVFHIDGMWLEGARYSSYATDAVTPQRDMAVTDDSLLTDAECTARAESLLWQLQNTPIRIDVETVGNTNIKIGDRLSMTIPAEGISAQNYDVLTVEHTYTKNPSGFRTRASLVTAGDNRKLPVGTPLEAVGKTIEFQKQIGKGLKVIR